MENKSNATVWIVVVGILGLLLGCVLGVLLGGIGAFAVSRSTSYDGPTPYYEYSPMPDFGEPELVPEYGIPDRPATPAPVPSMPMMASSAMVIAVTPDSPAEDAGLMAGDIITHIDGQEINDRIGPADIIAGLEPGDTVRLTVVRGDETMALTAQVGSNPDDQNAPWLGITYRMVRGLPGGSLDSQGD